MKGVILYCWTQLIEVMLETKCSKVVEELCKINIFLEIRKTCRLKWSIQILTQQRYHAFQNNDKRWLSSLCWRLWWWDLSGSLAGRQGRCEGTSRQGSGCCGRPPTQTWSINDITYFFPLLSQWINFCSPLIYSIIWSVSYSVNQSVIHVLTCTCTLCSFY